MKAPAPCFSAARDAGRIDALAGALATKVTPEIRGALGQYAELVAKWNMQLDLTAAKDARGMVEVLFADAMVLAREDLVPRRARVVDVGSGAGAPGLVLAILRSDVDVTLVEPLRKRVAFLRTAIGSLDLANRVRVVEAKIADDDEAPQPSGLDLAVSRATFSPEIWLRVGSRMASRVAVLTAAGPAPTDPSCRAVAHADYAIPSTSAPRRITLYARSEESLAAAP